MKKYSLTKAILGSKWMSEGLIANSDGSLSKAYILEPLSSGLFEEDFGGPSSDSFFSKLADLMTRLPNLFEGHFLLSRQKVTDSEIPGFQTKVYIFEKVTKAESYSHIKALLEELKMLPQELEQKDWQNILSCFLGEDTMKGSLPDVIWDQDSLKIKDKSVRVLSLTELPQVTWKGALQSIFEDPSEFTLSLRFSIPDRTKIRKQLETKRRVSHALSVTNASEIQNIESNSVLHSSEETLERILISKESLFEISIALISIGSDEDTISRSRNFERLISGIGNAGLFQESVGALPVFKSHLPGNKVLGIRRLPILSENLTHLMPILHDYSRLNERSHLELRSRSLEVSHLNLFSKENLNYNSFICGASGSGKSFLMNAILKSNLKDEPQTRICIFDVGGSYKKIVNASGGKETSLNFDEARSLMASFLKIYPVKSSGFFRAFLQTLCGTGTHITHSHLVAIDDLLNEVEGENLKIKKIIENANKRDERFYKDIAHWLKPHIGLDKVKERPDLIELIKSQVSSFDFKELDSDPVLQKATILLLTELLWSDLVSGQYKRTLIVFDEVWRFFNQSKDFLEEMYRTLRKYKAGIVSITQNLADYGDEAFAKMLFTNSFTKIFLQNGASAEYLKDTFDLPETDIQRALSVSSKKPVYSEFFVLTPAMSQVFRLYPTSEFYELANTENIAATGPKCSD